MSSGKKNYFRHSMNARNDHKLRAFMELFGRNWREGYFYFFTLLELCGSDAQEGKIEHTFHKKTLRDLWGTSTQGVQDVCMRCAESALVMCIVSADHVTFSIPSLLNYTGRYEQKAPNKENKTNKTNKGDEAPTLTVADDYPPDFFETIDAPEKNLPKKNSQEKLKIRPSEVLALFNAILGKSCKLTPSHSTHISARINEGYSISDFEAAIKHKRSEWANDPRMRKFLRPETIFGTKFDSYLQESKDANKPIVDPLEQWFRDQGHEPERAS